MHSSYLMKPIVINPKILVINYVKSNTFFNKIIGYNNIKNLLAHK